VDAIISMRELSAKCWKGSQRGEVWGWWAFLGNCDAPQFSRAGVAGADAAPIAQSNNSPFTGRSQAQRLM
jgi:hypothetical protein